MLGAETILGLVLGGIPLAIAAVEQYSAKTSLPNAREITTFY